MMPMNLDFKYFMSVFWRRFPYFITVASIFTCIGLTLAVILPPQYEASSNLLVESAQIPDRLAASTVQTRSQEQIQIIQQRLMTRANLLDIADRLEVFEPTDATGQPMTASKVVDQMRARTTITSKSGKNQATQVTVSFRAPTPQLAAGVVNEIVTMLLQENVEMRTNLAGDTMEFFRQEATRLGADLDTQGTRILEFKNQNAEALPENETYIRERQSFVQGRLGQIDSELVSLTNQRAQMVDLFKKSGQISASTAEMTPEQRALQEAQKQLDSALLVYSESNPRVKLLRARVSQLQDTVAGAGGTETEAESGEALLNAQLREIDAKINQLKTEQSDYEGQMEKLQANLLKLPANSLQLEGLQRAFDATRQRYQAASDRLAAAETGERIELLSKGERISVIEQAVPPTSPTAPGRAMIAAGGAGAGAVLGFGMVFLLEMLNRSIRRPIELTSRLGITPIAVLPYIRTERETSRRRAVVLGIFGLLVIVVPLALFVVHSQVTPLDLILEKLLNRIGFSLGTA
jgi:polysaccharide chain length determinant protein (PEP-CTERM system associated)